MNGAALAVFAALLSGPPMVVGHVVTADDTEAHSVRRGAELAVADAGPGFRLVVRRSVDPWKSGSGDAARLVADDSAELLIAPPDSDGAHLAAQVATKLRVPLLVSSLDPTLTRVGVPWIHRTLPDARQQLEMLSADLMGRRGLRRIAALAPDDRDGRIALAELSRAALSHGATIDPVLRHGVDPWSSLSPNSDEGPQAIVLLGAAEPMGRALRILRARGIELPAYATSRLHSPRLLAAAGPAAEGLFCLAVLDAALDGAAERYRQRFGEAPDAFALATYDGTRRRLAAKSARSVPLQLVSVRDGRFVVTHDPVGPHREQGPSR